MNSGNPRAIAALRVLTLLTLLSTNTLAENNTLPGYAGIWYGLGTPGPYGYKYSGGLGTYPQQHGTLATYAHQVNRTYFVYGSDSPDGLASAISYYDHTTGLLARPRVLTVPGGDDAHNNPTMTILEDGRLFVADNAHGFSRDSSFLISEQPWDISAFTTTLSLTRSGANFSYGNPYTIPGQGVLFLHTHYDLPPDGAERNLYWNTSPDGITWDHKWNLNLFPDHHRPLLSNLEKGQYQVSSQYGNVVGTAFNMHPASSPNGSGLNARTNLYYLQTPDAGRTWTAANGATVQTPLTDTINPALVAEYASAGLNVYLKQTTFDTQGNPVLVYLTADDYSPGPDRFDRTLHTARWTGSTWDIRDVLTTDHNYDQGSMVITQAEDGSEIWSILGPYLDGSSPWRTGGDLGYWQSDDLGQTWQLSRQPLPDAATHHTYVRNVNKAQDAFAFLWADGDPDTFSTSHLYFANADATRVYRMPLSMEHDFALPELVWAEEGCWPEPGDLNGDGVINANDIDSFIYATCASSGDLDTDGQVSQYDLDHLVTSILGTTFGDANLDRRVDLLDLSQLAASFGQTGGWADGDFDLNGIVNLNDLSILAANFGFDGTAVPEPSIPVLVAIMGLQRRRRL
ncbi:BNR-4 repeat-containing protein [Mucisphaera calidilacus]|uniref:Dockerin domain-containing protein n=1 Tax=Mucisphaera calidilacus TaxID=2527982 RepID=A0A518C079_9BACT|nr:BNR-4 repeat-containing protein [Mucisphaera calidilacus]QDU72630.1 hypothetical protein Pan265_25020 [Mucisphaera calidilacus]